MHPAPLAGGGRAGRPAPGALRAAWCTWPGRRLIAGDHSPAAAGLPRVGKDILAGAITAPTIALRRIAPTADAARRDTRAWPDVPADAAGAWRRDGFAVLPGCLDGPGLEAARRDHAAFVRT
jgi:hypothetical protein